MQDIRNGSDSKYSLKGDIEFKCMRKMHQKLNHKTLLKQPCAVCWEDVYASSLRPCFISEPTSLAYFTQLETMGRWDSRAEFSFAPPFQDFNGLPLFEKAFDSVLESIPVCSMCSHHLDTKKLPPRSVANNLWIGEQTETMKNLSIPAKLLTSPIRQKMFVFKCITYGNPKEAQHGVKGSTIAFHQDNVVPTSTSLPLSVNQISDNFQIIFVGNREPSPAQMEKLFSVKRVTVETVLSEYKANGHPGYIGQDTWNAEALQELEGY